MLAICFGAEICIAVAIFVANAMELTRFVFWSGLWLIFWDSIALSSLSMALFGATRVFLPEKRLKAASVCDCVVTNFERNHGAATAFAKDIRSDDTENSLKALPYRFPALLPSIFLPVRNGQIILSDGTDFSLLRKDIRRTRHAWLLAFCIGLIITFFPFAA